MAPWRKWLFVIYAIASWVYRWVITFSILWFLADFLGPKLKILSQMLAVVSLASMFIWPTYRIVKNIRQRGRLPDMKAARVYITLAVLIGFIAAFFFVPLPVSRVHETGLVEIDPAAIEIVSLEEPATLTALRRPLRTIRPAGEPARRVQQPATRGGNGAGRGVASPADRDQRGAWRGWSPRPGPQETRRTPATTSSRNRKPVTRRRPRRDCSWSSPSAGTGCANSRPPAAAA